MNKKFIRPNIPGWECFETSLSIMLSEKKTEQASEQVISSFIARKHELIPPEHHSRICNKVLAILIKDAELTKESQLFQPGVDFLHFQLGKVALQNLLKKKGGWEIYECDCERSKLIGYHVISSEVSRLIQPGNLKELIDRIFGQP